jgi:hypothetical protein
VKRLADLDLEALVRTEGTEVAFSSLTDSGWTLTGGAQQRLLEKLRKTGTPLGEYVGGEIYYGIKTGLNEAFVIDAATRERLIAQDPKSAEIIKPFLLGRDVKRYRSPGSGRYLILFPKGWTAKTAGSTDEESAWKRLEIDYPAIAGHLRPFADRGRKRCDRGDFWWELRECAYYEEFEKPKILWPEIAGSARFAFDETGFYANNKAYLIPTGDLYLLGLLNSSLLRFFIHSVCTDLQGNSFNFSAVFLKRTPIRAIDFAVSEEKARHDRIVALVERMLRLHQEPPEPLPPEENENRLREIAKTDAEIDSLVCDLYGLTAEEIRILEESGRTTDS